MMEEQLIHTQHFVIIYIKTISVNSWLDISCVLATKDDFSCYVILDHIEAHFTIFKKNHIEINHSRIKITKRKH
jgi:hypothetical protein